MKKISSILFFFYLFSCSPDKIVDSGAKPVEMLEPLTMSVGKLTVSIDPRNELLSVVQLLSSYPEVGNERDYCSQINERFAAYSSLEAVAITDRLDQNGFAYDAPPTTTLYFSQPYEMKLLQEYDPQLVQRAGSRKILEEYRVALNDFAQKTDFLSFWEDMRGYYESIITASLPTFSELDMIAAIESYYNMQQNSYNVILSPAYNGHNYGPMVENSEGNFDLYAFLSLYSDPGSDIPKIDFDILVYLLFHEFGHSFVNPLCDLHGDELDKSAELFEPIAQIMQNMAYGTWRICVYEHILRAVVIRMIEIHFDEEAARMWLNYDIGEGFIYIEPIVEVLKEYETQRDMLEISFADFFPRIVDVIISLKPQEVTFSGPIGNVITTAEKFAMIYPTGGDDLQGNERVLEYAGYMFDYFGSENDIKISDSEALGVSLADYALWVYGTFESNLYLSHHRESFCFDLRDGVLYADREYNQPSIRYITCWPNPENPKLGMLIYTAHNNSDLWNINAITHGNTDYLITTDGLTEHYSGYYLKYAGSWTF